jgi:flavin-dependent dehydrogenase
MAYDSTRRRIVMFGGRTRNFQFFGDTWEWDGGSWSQVMVSGPSARQTAAMAFDPLASQGIIKALDQGRRAATSISAYLEGDDSSLERFALHLRREYAVFQATRHQYYRLEQRWPRSIFWRRRNAVANGRSDTIDQSIPTGTRAAS